jgi:glycosyltransferase involved in cell wall biosynthesis
MMGPTEPHVSVLVPCRNERSYIGRCLDSILANDYPSATLEILVIDGMSDDGTATIVQEYARRVPHLRLLHNMRRVVPAALNLGITEARGEIVIRMDAHNEYPPTYISRLVGWLERTGADNVGGAWITRPADNSAVARAIAFAVAHRFGIGNAQYRLGNVSKPTPVDTVPFGCFRKELFDRLGMFDEELVRNQDDEFNYRLLKSGGRILLVPDVESYYYARASLRTLARTYYQYGFFKPLVAVKVRRVMTLRQLAPGSLVGAMGVALVLAAWYGPARTALAGLLGAYLAMNVAISLSSGCREGWRYVLALLGVFPVLHFSYGAGWLVGASRLLLGRWQAVRPDALPLSR